MRAFIAGFMTFLTYFAMYYIAPRVKVSYAMSGTMPPKLIEILFHVSDIVVHYYYVLLPVLFVTFLSVLVLALPTSDKNEE